MSGEYRNCSFVVTLFITSSPLHSSTTTQPSCLIPHIPPNPIVATVVLGILPVPRLRRANAPLGKVASLVQLAGRRVDVAALAERDVAVVALPAGAGAVFDGAAGEFVGYRGVDAGFACCWGVSLRGNGMGRGGEGDVLESLPLWPLRAASEPRSRSACSAILMGLLDMLDDVLDFSVDWTSQGRLLRCG